MDDMHHCESEEAETKSGLSRRQFVGATLSGALAGLFANPVAALSAGIGKRPKACILLWLDGGPSQLDTFDPKPGAVSGGPFKAIKTAARGVRVAEHLPQLAACMDDIALIRSLTSKEGNHQRAKHLLHTGYLPQPTVRYPSLGSLLTYEQGGDSAALPSYITIGNIRYGAGFLGQEYAPFSVSNPQAAVKNLDITRSINPNRFNRRLALRAQLDESFAATRGGEAAKAFASTLDDAVAFMSAEEKKAFDLTNEPAAVRSAYGDSQFGAGCLMARRLVENSARFVEVSLSGWDTHRDNFTRVKELSGQLDPAFAALIRDLKERDLLNDTLVVCTGEFGRKPQINDTDGRDHHPGCWSLAMAGGGVRGGQVIGATDDSGGAVVDRPVGVGDLYHTLCGVLGMNPAVVNYTPEGRPIKLAPEGVAVRELMA